MKTIDKIERYLNEEEVVPSEKQKKIACQAFVKAKELYFKPEVKMHTFRGNCCIDLCFPGDSYFDKKKQFSELEKYLGKIGYFDSEWRDKLGLSGDIVGSGVEYAPIYSWLRELKMI